MAGEDQPSRPSGRAASSQRPPVFSLAGSHGFMTHQQSFVDPNYYQHNPEYNKPQEQPVWGLARPLPRVVRSRLRQEKLKENKAPQPTGGNTACANFLNAKGSSSYVPNAGDHEHEPNTEATPQVARIASQLSDSHGGGSQETRTRPERHEELTSPPDSQADRSDLRRYRSPLVEIGDPMNQWAAEATRAPTESADTCSQNLPTVREVPSPMNSDFQTPDGKQTPVKELDYTIQGGIEEGTLREEDYIYSNRWSTIRTHLREPMAEFLATFVAILLGLSTTLSVLTSSNKAGTYQSSNWAGGLGFMVGIYIAGGISGGHLNPAISLTLCVFRGFPPRKVLVFIPAQLLGAFLAALVAFAIYHQGIMQLDGGLLNSSRAEYSGQAFLTGLQVDFPAWAGFLNEFVASAILVGTVLALGDDENAPPGAGMHALIMGLVVVVLGMAFGYPTGACLNPVRDLGPRLAALAVGYGGDVFSGGALWWLWGGCAAPICGGLFGGLLYDGFILVGSESPVNYVARKRRRRKGRAGEKSE